MLLLGVGAQWLAWRLRVPAILPLLVVGLLAGPGAMALMGRKLLDPDKLFGDLLLPGVSLAVSVILFEGGLSLRREELQDVAGVVRRLCSAGVAVTWALAALAAWGLGLLPFAQALLLGAILTVTGPTVIGPLLHHVRLRGATATILRWEGIVVDPIGAILALLVFEVARAASLDEGAMAAAQAFAGTLVVGSLTGLAGGVVIVESVRRPTWCPDVLENAVALAVVLGVYAGANALQHESGLLAVTVLGILVANRLRVQELRHIIEFKENLKVVLLAALFVVLAARLGVDDLRGAIGWRSLAFVAVLIAVVRPASVAASTAGTRLPIRARLYLAAMAPRGIVACAVSAVFALRLAEAGHADALALPSITVLVIVVTVSFYGLAAAPLARRLGLADPDPQGLLVLGAHALARQLARALRREGVEVLLVDANHANVLEAQAAGLRAVHANALSDFVVSELDLDGIGQLLAMTPNDEVNALATQRLGQQFGAANVFQLPPKTLGDPRHDVAHHHRVRYLFGSTETYRRLVERLEAGATLKVERLGPELTQAKWRAARGANDLPLFVLSKGRVSVLASDSTPTPASGDVVISLVSPAVSGSPPASPEARAAVGPGP